MPIEVGIWKLGKTLERVQFSTIESEKKLEETLAKDLSVLSPDLLLIGRQIATAYGKYIDILAMDGDGNLAVIELKRNRTPREVVAQLLDYASWVQGLTYDDLTDIYESKNPGWELEQGFAEAFGESPPEEMNLGHELYVVAAELDPGTERIIAYLSKTHGVPINAVFFRYFREGENEYITRSWLIDPAELRDGAGPGPRPPKGKEPWNKQDFYVSFGEGGSRDWDDARRYGFISAGGKKWFTGKLSNLKPGHRVFVNIPGTGYVGVGEVVEEVKRAKEFTVEVDCRETPFMQAPRNARYHEDEINDPDACEHFVRVRWLKAVPRKDAYWEKGFFANQSSVCKLRNKFTLERLSRHFGLDE